MFAKLLARWRERRLRKRAFFRFHDGHGWRYVDPFKAWRDYQNHPTFDFASKLEYVDRGDQEETENCLAALCEIFGVTRWDEKTLSGMTDWEILNVFDNLLLYLDALKKNTSAGPISSEPTEPGSSISPAPQDKVSRPSEASGSTPSESNSAMPCESSTASKAPLPSSST